MAEQGLVNIGGRMVPAWLLDIPAEALDSLASITPHLDKLEWILGNYNGEQLLDNAYLANLKTIVNQRRQSVYTNTAAGQVSYTIDRWALVNRGSLSVDSAGVLITNDGLDPWFNFIQRLSKLKNGEVYTLSLLYKSATTDFILSLQYKEGYTLKNVVVPASEVENLVSLTVTAHDIGEYLQVVSLNAGGKFVAGSIRPIAFKLERGPYQTLAHQDAEGNWVLNKAPTDNVLELLKCQGFQYPIFAEIQGPILTGYLTGNATNFESTIKLPAPLHKVPTLVVDNVTVTIRTIAGYSSLATYTTPGTPSSIRVEYSLGNDLASIKFGFPSALGENNTPATLSFRSGSILLDSNS